MPWDGLCSGITAEFSEVRACYKNKALSQDKLCHLSALILLLGVAFLLPVWLLRPCIALFELNWCGAAKNVHVLTEQAGKRRTCFHCTVLSWPPCPGSKSPQSPGHVMDLHELLPVRSQEMLSHKFFLPPTCRYNCCWLWLIVQRVLLVCKVAALCVYAGCQQCLH